MGPFQKWILSLGGFTAAAELIGVSRTAVKWWFYRHGRPRADKMTRIVKLSRGALTLEDVIRDTGVLTPSQAQRLGAPHAPRPSGARS